MNDELLSPSFMSEVSLGKSSHHFMSSSPLRMINSLEFPSEKQNASFPNRMEVNSGKSIHHFIFAKALRMINLIDASHSKQKTPRPNRTEVNAGRSIHQSLSDGFTLKHDTRTTIASETKGQKTLR